jgi:tetratricopeptide (TPR) repeat protein
VRRILLFGLVAVTASVGAGGCVYYNTLYNAQERFSVAESARLAGDAQGARRAYEEAVEKAGRGFRSDPGGRWADDALYLMGRAWFRMGELTRAVRALQTALARSDSPEVRRGATLYLGAARARLGEGMAALGLLNEAMRGLEPGPLAAEGHFWRGVLHFELGRRDQGLWDLARAVEADARLLVPALMARAAHGVAAGDTAMIRVALSGLAGTARGAGRVDSLSSLVSRLERERGPAVAASVLAPVTQAGWPPGPREELLLLRADLLAAAGDTAAARESALWLAEGAGPRSTAARLALARWRLARLGEVEELGEVSDLLLPAGSVASAIRLRGAILQVELLERWGAAGEHVAFFAAAETARDALGAPRLARAFFLRYVAEQPDAPWAGKAMLAALATTPDPSGDAALRRGLEARTWDPYVASVRTGTVGSDRVQRLEAELARRLGLLRTRAEAEARRRDLTVAARDTAGAPPRPFPLPAPRRP